MNPKSDVCPPSGEELKTALDGAQHPEEDGGEPRTEPTERAGPSTRAARFPIVGIGASAGGLEALQAIVRRLRPDSMSFVIVQHLSPVHESLLTELLARLTSMSVKTVVDGVVVEPNHIYVIPANSDMLIRDGVLHLLPTERTVPRVPIDSFFRSLASDLGPSAIGVVLSGGGSDGTLGLKAIKAEGGITFVQDPGTATHSSMPQNALDSGSADFCLPPEEIADELMRVSAHPYVVRTRLARAVSHGGLTKIFGQLRAAFGVDFTLYKHSTLQRRIERRMAVHRLQDIDDYIKILQTNGEELDTLYRDMLIGVTSFFRDNEVFDALKAVVFPRMLERRPRDGSIRIWVAGCSTGEEPYSVAMSLLEFLGAKASSYKIQIFATDLDEDAIRQARQGTYRSSIELDVSADRLQRFFIRKDGDYQVSRQMRDLVIFATQDLGKDPPFSRLDLITCRNVLIYMQSPLQKKVLRIFHYALKTDGFLLLGSSESVGEGAELFSLLDRKLKIHVKHNTPTTAVFDFGSGSALSSPSPRELVGAPLTKTALSLQQVVDRKVMERYGPPSVVISAELDVLQFRGRTSPYLEPAPGAATLNILKLARPELLVELRAVIHKALTEDVVAVSPAIQMKTERGVRPIVLEAFPLQEVEVHQRSLLVAFREILPLTVAASEPAEEGGKDPRIPELERELTSTKEFLQATIEELEGANEELQSANEELQSANEELQSTNEELETSKEELQSNNEELATVNEELHSRMSELAQNHDDLHNLLATIANPLIVVGMDLRVRSFSRSAEKHLGLLPADAGRPVAHFRSYLNEPGLERMVTEVIDRIAPVEREVRSTDGNTYRMRIVPYKTADHAIRGALLELAIGAS